MRQALLSVDQKTVRRVERERPVLIRTNDEGREVSEKVVRRVEIAARARPDIRSVPVAQARAAINGEHLQLSILRTSTTAESERPPISRHHVRPDDQLIRGGAL